MWNGIYQSKYLRLILFFYRLVILHLYQHFKAEKRKDQRIREEKKVVIEFYPGGKDPRPKNVTYALARDISEGGVRLLTDRFFPVGTLLKITLSLSRTRQIVNVVSKVKWVQNFHTSDLFEMGIEYVHEIPEFVLSMMKNHDGEEAKAPSSVWK